MRYNKVYLIGSLRNPKVPELGQEIRTLGYAVFDDWFAAGPEADDYLYQYERGRDHSYIDALEGLAVDHVFHFDRKHLFEADVGVLLLPAGKSGHLELGILIGRGKRTYILLDGEPERFEVMYRFATAVYARKKDLLDELKRCR